MKIAKSKCKVDEQVDSKLKDSYCIKINQGMPNFERNNGFALFRPFAVTISK
jgi:hypothetical protein